MFDLNDSPTHYIFAVGNHQQETLAKRAMHTSVVEIVIQFGQSEVPRRRLFDQRATEATGRARHNPHSGQI